MSVLLGGKRVNLWPHIIKRNPAMGGVSVLGLGQVGSGKTALLIHIARRKLEDKRELKKKPDITDKERLIADELLFWIDDPDCQWRRLPDYIAKKRIFVHRDLYKRLKFYMNGNEIDVLTIPFDNFDELIELSDPMMLNVVYFPTREGYVDFIIHLIKAPKFRWFSVFTDELERLIWQYGGGDFLKKIQVVVDAMGRQRKRRVSIYAGTHNKSLIHWQFIKLIKYFAFLPGAKAIYDTRVNQACIDALKLGEFRLATAGKWDNPARTFPSYEVEDDLVVEGLDEIAIPTPNTIAAEPVVLGRPRTKTPILAISLPSIAKADKPATMSHLAKTVENDNVLQVEDILETNKEKTPSPYILAKGGNGGADNQNSAA